MSYADYGNYTGYIVDKTSGILYASSDPAQPPTGSATTKAVDSTNEIISSSYKFLCDNGYSNSITVTTVYEQDDMVIQQSAFSDSTGSLNLQIVFVSIQSPESVKVESDNDDKVSYSFGTFIAAIVASAAAGLALIVAVVLAVRMCRGGASHAKLVEFDKTRNVL